MCVFVCVYAYDRDGNGDGIKEGWGKGEVGGRMANRSRERYKGGSEGEDRG